MIDADSISSPDCCRLWKQPELLRALRCADVTSETPGWVEEHTDNTMKSSHTHTHTHTAITGEQPVITMPVRLTHKRSARMWRACHSCTSIHPSHGKWVNMVACECGGGCEVCVMAPLCVCCSWTANNNGGRCVCVIVSECESWLLSLTHTSVRVNGGTPLQTPRSRQRGPSAGHSHTHTSATQTFQL